MLCYCRIARFLARVVNLEDLSSKVERHLKVRFCPQKNHRRFRTIPKMMVDSESELGAIGKALHDDGDHVEEGGLSSGGWKSEDGRLSCGFSSFMGKRASMEDFYDIKSSKIEAQEVNLFGIFDGHGGSRAAEYLKEHLFENLMKHPQFMTDTKLAIRETYKKTDADFLEAESNTLRDDGSTASTAVLVGNHLYVANVGDSRAVISKAGKAIPLSDDHKPNRSDERKRIEDAGGVVLWAGTWRVGGVLAMSRAFGNRLLKQFVVAEPEIQEQEVDGELEFLVLASDGLWDVVTNEDAVSLARGVEPEAAAQKLTETAYTRGSADNITCIVVRFHHNDTTVVDSPSASGVDSPPPTTLEDSPSPESEISTLPIEESPAGGVGSPPTPVADFPSAGGEDSPAPTPAVDSHSAGSVDSLLPGNKD